MHEKLSLNIELSLLNIPGLFKNLFSVITGNIIGGTFVAGFVYWIIIVKPQQKKFKNKEEGD